MRKVTLLTLIVAVLSACAPRPATVSCRNTGTKFDVSGGIKTWVSVNYNTEHAAFEVFPNPKSYVGSMVLPTGFCDVRWLPD